MHVYENDYMRQLKKAKKPHILVVVQCVWTKLNDTSAAESPRERLVKGLRPSKSSEVLHNPALSIEAH